MQCPSMPNQWSSIYLDYFLVAENVRKHLCRRPVIVTIKVF